MQIYFSHTLVMGVLAAVTLSGCAPASVAEISNSAVPKSSTHVVANRTLYVSLSGSDSNDGLSALKALRSPQKAADMSMPGDVIEFAEGTYEIQQGGALIRITRSGEPDKPIVYTAAPGAKAVLYNSGAWDAIKIVGARHIEIRGLQIRGHREKVTLEEARREMNNLKNPHTSDNGIAITEDATTKTPSAYITVRNCIIRDCGGGGLFANHSDYLTFENNVVSHCGFWSPYANSGISIYQPADIDDSKDYKIIIRGNVSHDNYNYIPFFYSNAKEPAKRKVTDGNGIIIDDFMNSQSWGGGSKPYSGKALVANNVVFGNGGSGIHAFKSTNTDIVHNYAFDNNRHPDIKDGQIFSNSSKNVRIANNVMVAPSGKPVNSDFKNEDVVYDYNLYATVDGGTPTFVRDRAHNIIADPGLTLTQWSEGKRDIKLTSNSSLRSAGMPISAVDTDFFGKRRDPQKPDIGPFVLRGR